MVVLREGICPGVNKDFIKALRSVDIRTAEDFVSCNPEDLAQKCSLSYKALVAVRRVLLAQFSSFPVSGDLLYEELLSSMAIISSGCASLDGLLDQGLYTGEVTELAGGPGSGKTQVCFSTALHVSHHLKHSVVYIDTKADVSGARLLQMLKARSPSAEQQTEALRRIQVLRAFDVFSLLSCLQHLRCGALQKSSVGCGSVRAVIVDSVSAVLSGLLGGKQNEGLSLLMQVAGELKMIARNFNLAVLVTNHVTSDGGDQFKAGLGQSWSHVPRTRVLLQRAAGPAEASARTATLTKSSRQPCGLMAQFDLSSGLIQAAGQDEDCNVMTSQERR